jgi:hypothetical protein
VLYRAGIQCRSHIYSALCKTKNLNLDFPATLRGDAPIDAFGITLITVSCTPGHVLDLHVFYTINGSPIISVFQILCDNVVAPGFFGVVTKGSIDRIMFSDSPYPCIIASSCTALCFAVLSQTSKQIHKQICSHHTSLNIATIAIISISLLVVYTLTNSAWDAAMTPRFHSTPRPSLGAH